VGRDWGCIVAVKAVEFCFLQKVQEKFFLGLFTLDNETSALFLNILYPDNSKENVMLHISMANAVM
jgi:hypothetical protein